MSEQQVLNYLLWLRERGQHFFVPAPPRVEELSPASLVETEVKPAMVAAGSGALPVEVEAPVETTPVPSPIPVPVPRPAVHPLKLIFVSITPLDEAEQEMVVRIAGALNIKREDFAISSAAETKDLLSEQGAAQLVIMGEDAQALIPSERLTAALKISHPGAMLREPTLKVSAWQTLQKLKAAL